MFIKLLCFTLLIYINMTLVYLQSESVRNSSDNGSRADNISFDYELQLAFVLFRHGDRTPTNAEISRFPSVNLSTATFYPYGLGALTNQGKRRAYKVGEYLRKRYNGFLSELYIPEEISIRTTDINRTKMTVLTALAALYPPKPLQTWNDNLNWQPIPYDTRPGVDDDLDIYRSCPIYSQLKRQVYDLPEIRNKIQIHENFMTLLSEKAGYLFNTTVDVYFFHNVVKILENNKIKLPDWVNDVKPKLIELENLGFLYEFHTPQQKSLGGGVLLGEIINACNAFIAGTKYQPKMHLYSGHEISLMAFMSALNIFSNPHCPNYGSALSFELYKSRNTDQFGVMAVYAPNADGLSEVMPIPGCGEQMICDYIKFLNLTRNVAISRSDFRNQCNSIDII